MKNSEGVQKVKKAQIRPREEHLRPEMDQKRANREVPAGDGKKIL